MHVVSRIKLPSSAETSELYIQCNEAASINYNAGDQEIVLRQGGMVSSNCYFNSFYEKFYAKYTELGSIYYLLKIEGDFQVSVYREVYGGSDRELISTEKLEKSQISDYVKVVLPNLLTEETAGRIYFELVCLSEQGLFKSGLIATEQDKNREVSLGIISCTFKKEVYIKSTVSTILQDEELQNKALKIFIVDNGITLTEDDFRDSRVKLIPNRNVGGSGGFTRGLIEALESNTYSHFLFMDDDIELDSESIYRLFSLYEYAKFDFAVAGSMLDLYKKHVLYESGALHGRNINNNMAFDPFVCASLKHNIDMKNATSLNRLLVEENIDYGAFWFFCFSKEVVEEIGLPLPIFIKLDDVEFSLRIKERSGNIVAFPSIAVWHEPFYAKFPIWDVYYVYRNHLITYAIHGSLGYINAFKYITKDLIYSLLFFEYNYAEMIVKGFEDYLKGPGFLKSNDPEVLHSNILKLSKSYKSQNVQNNYSPNNQVYQKAKPGSLKKFVSLLTINGHLLPNFLNSGDDVFVWLAPGYPGQRSKAFAKKKVNIFREKTACLYQNEIDKSAGIKLLTRWFKLAAKSSTKWSSISQEWKTASRELSSTTFWQQYLGLKK